MITYEDLTYIVDGDLSADIVGPWIDTSGFDVLVWQSWNSFSPNDAVIYCEGTNDPAKGHVHSDYSTFSSAGQQGISIVPKWIRLAYRISNGGFTNPSGTLSISVIGRKGPVRSV